LAAASYEQLLRFATIDSSNRLVLAGNVVGEV
jgi:hypothetical protein